jgi:hypothetical protein
MAAAGGGEFPALNEQPQASAGGGPATQPCAIRPPAPEPLACELPLGTSQDTYSGTGLVRFSLFDLDAVCTRPWPRLQARSLALSVSP